MMAYLLADQNTASSSNDAYNILPVPYKLDLVKTKEMAKIKLMENNAKKTWIHVIQSLF